MERFLLFWRLLAKVVSSLLCVARRWKASEKVATSCYSTVHSRIKFSIFVSKLPFFSMRVHISFRGTIIARRALVVVSLWPLLMVDANSSRGQITLVSNFFSRSSPVHFCFVLAHYIAHKAD